MGSTITSEPNRGQIFPPPLELVVRHQLGTPDEQRLFVALLVFLRNLLRNTPSRDKVKLAEYATYTQCEQLGLSREQIGDILAPILETGEILRRGHSLSGMF